MIGEPLTPNQLDKKKAFEQISSGLKLVNGIATWNNHKLIIFGDDSSKNITAETIKEGIIR